MTIRCSLISTPKLQTPAKPHEMSSFEGNSQIQQKKKCAFVNKRGWGQCEVRAGYRQLNSRMWPHSSCVGGATAVSSLRGHCCVHLAERFKKKTPKKTGPAGGNLCNDKDTVLFSWNDVAWCHLQKWQTIQSMRKHSFRDYADFYFGVWMRQWVNKL